MLGGPALATGTHEELIERYQGVTVSYKIDCRKDPSTSVVNVKWDLRVWFPPLIGKQWYRTTGF
jgi:hypothetical protein